MTAEEFSNQFDVLYNNITSNQAPGLTEYEKTVFLTKAQNEIVKNYFTANSKGNNIQQGFDDSAKRQADFSCLMVSKVVNSGTLPTGYSKIDPREDTAVYKFPTDVFIAINETIILSKPSGRILQVVPLRYDEYLRLMSKPYKRPLKYQAWRLINTGTSDGSSSDKYVEIITGPGQTIQEYNIRYIRFPKPIIVGPLDGLTVNGYVFTGDSEGTPTEGCELDPIIHEDILQRAIELAKVAWTATGQDNMNPVIEAGQRSE